ncbi:DoxX family protein [Nonomuraea sp. LPB2021202275-12-8]|uniref:DoxX family protein n=1 Tax=Nonomuraea sp. LPB2021202275-12-8 TaxID=3120159 RepID=UPI00300D7372
MKQTLRDLAALVARMGVGGIFFANGWRKLEVGLAQTGVQFQGQGAPAPRAWATVTMLTELIGGALLIAGLMVSVTGLILFAEAVAVLWVAPPLNPITLNELILLGAAALLLAVVGAGRISVDHMVVIRRRESEAASEFAADNEADAVINSLRDPTAPHVWEKDSAAEEPAKKDAGKTGKKDTAGAKTAESEASLEDTAPHARPRLTDADPAPSDEPAPGDTLVAGRKKPPARTRRPTSGD